MKNQNILSISKEGIKINLTMLSLFLFLFYPYFNTTTKIIYQRESIAKGTLILAVILLLIKTSKIKIDRWVMIWFSVLFFFLFRNYDLKYGNYYICIEFAVCILMLLLLSTKYNWESYSMKLIYLFSIIHLFFGFFLYFNKNFFIDHIVPTFFLDDFWLNELMIMVNAGYMVGLTSHFSTLGMYLSVAFILGITYLLNQKATGKSKTAIIIFIAATVAAFMLNGKRGPFIFSCLTALIVYLFFYCRVSPKTILKWIFYGIIITATLMIAIEKIPALATLFNRFQFSNGNINDYSSDRVDLLWIPALKLFQQHPIFGLGWRGFRYTFQQYSTIDQLYDTHNIYLQLLCETGIVGFTVVMTAFITTYARTAKLLFRIKRNNNELMAKTRLFLCFSAMVQTFFLLYGLTGNPLYDRIFYLYVIAYGLMVTAERRIRVATPNRIQPYVLQDKDLNWASK